MIQKPSIHFLAVLMLGIVSQVGQVLLIREFLVVFHGNELSIGLILASWLLWIGIGSRLGPVLINRGKKHSSILYLNISTLSLLVILPGTILLIRNLRGFFDIIPGAYLSLFDMTISSFLLMAPACLILGAQFVFLSRVWREHLKREDTSGAEKTYIGEAAGNMLGGILFTLVMVYYLNSFQGAIIVILVMFFIVLLMTIFAYTHLPTSSISLPNFFRLKKFYITLSVLFAVLILAFPLYFSHLNDIDEWAHRLQWEDFAMEHDFVNTYQSRHGTIFVSRHENQYSLFQNGHLIYSVAGPEVDMPGHEEQDALDFAHLAMIQHENSEDVLLIGGGIRGTLGEILRYPVEKVDYFQVIQFVQRFRICSCYNKG